MSLRSIIHLLLHVAVPALVAWLLVRDPLRSPMSQGKRPRQRLLEGRTGAAHLLQTCRLRIGMLQIGMLHMGLFQRAWLLLMLGWVIDLDHLLAVPVYAPDRCSIGFHPLHTAPAVLVYAALTIPRSTRWFGIGLLIHIGLDLIDCLWMRQGL